MDNLVYTYSELWHDAIIREADAVWQQHILVSHPVGRYPDLEMLLRLLDLYC